MAKIWKNRVTKFTSIFHFVWDILLVSYLFLGGSFAFKLYAIHQQFWENLKVQKFMPLQIHGLTLEFEVHASKRRLR